MTETEQALAHEREKVAVLQGRIAALTRERDEALRWKPLALQQAEQIAAKSTMHDEMEAAHVKAYRECSQERDEARAKLAQAEKDLRIAQDAHAKMCALVDASTEMANRATAQAARYRESLERNKQGYQNILEFRKLSGGRYGALTREELETVVAEIGAVLTETPAASLEAVRANWMQEFWEKDGCCCDICSAEFLDIGVSPLRVFPDDTSRCAHCIAADIEALREQEREKYRREFLQWLQQPVAELQTSDPAAYLTVSALIDKVSEAAKTEARREMADIVGKLCPELRDDIREAVASGQHDSVEDAVLWAVGELYAKAGRERAVRELRALAADMHASSRNSRGITGGLRRAARMLELKIEQIEAEGRV